jgi:hypothetical protein
MNVLVREIPETANVVKTDSQTNKNAPKNRAHALGFLSFYARQQKRNTALTNQPQTSHPSCVGLARGMSVTVVSNQKCYGGQVYQYVSTSEWLCSRVVSVFCRSPSIRTPAKLLDAP